MNAVTINARDPQYAGGVIADGIADDTAAVQAAVSAASAIKEGATKRVQLPAGQVVISNEIRATGFGVEIRGTGEATKIYFNPSAAKSCFKFQAASGLIARCGVADMIFTSPANKIAKVAVEFVDASQHWVENVHAVEGNWDSPGNIGFLFRGRELGRLGPHITMACERPVVFRANPNLAAIGCDHFRMVSPIQLIGRGKEQNPALTTRPLITKEAGCPVTSFSVDGVISLNRGSQGFLFLTQDGLTRDPQGSFGIYLRGLRREQSPNAVGAEQYAIEFRGDGAHIYNLTIDDAILGGHPGYGPSKGIRLLGCTSARVDNIHYDGMTAALEIGRGCDDVRWSTFFTNQASAGLLNTGGLEEIESIKTVQGGMPVSGHYVARASAPNPTYTSEEQQMPRRSGGVSSYHHRIGLAHGRDHRLPVNIDGTRKVLRIEVVARTASGKINRGVWVESDSQVFLTESFGSPGCAAGNVGGKLCVEHVNEFRTRVVNNTGELVEGFVSADFIV